MKVKFTLTGITLILIFSHCHTLKIIECDRCNLKYLVIAEGLTTKQNIRTALCTMSNSCINNTEFLEVSSQTLLILLEKEPNITINEICRLDKNKQNFILDQIKQHVDDFEKIDLIITQIESLTPSSDKKEKIIRRILEALNHK